jgi:hypothetical protein
MTVANENQVCDQMKTEHVLEMPAVCYFTVPSAFLHAGPIKIILPVGVKGHLLTLGEEHE